MGEDPWPLSLDHTNEFCLQLPADFADVPYVDEFAGDINLPVAENREISQEVGVSLKTKYPEITWINHIYTVSIEKNGELQERLMTYSGFISHS